MERFGELSLIPMFQFLVFVAIVIVPHLILSLTTVPQALGRGIIVAIWLFGFPVAGVWFAVKSQMIRPGGKLYQPRFDAIRPQIERNLRIIVVAFVLFWLYFETLPFGHDLIELQAGRALPRITREVKNVDSGYRAMGIQKTIGFASERENYYLWYSSKFLRVGDTYEFVVLPSSRIILDYRELNQ